MSFHFHFHLQSKGPLGIICSDSIRRHLAPSLVNLSVTGNYMVLIRPWDLRCPVSLQSLSFWQLQRVEKHETQTDSFLFYFIFPIENLWCPLVSNIYKSHLLSQYDPNLPLIPWDQTKRHWSIDWSLSVLNLWLTWWKATHLTQHSHARHYFFLMFAVITNRWRR